MGKSKRKKINAMIDRIKENERQIKKSLKQARLKGPDALKSEDAKQKNSVVEDVDLTEKQIRLINTILKEYASNQDKEDAKLNIEELNVKSNKAASQMVAQAI